MKTLNVKGQEILLDDEDYEKVFDKSWYIEGGYARSRTWGLLHNYLFPCPVGLVTDHINRNKLDNRRFNVRFVTRAINRINAIEKRGGVKGVYKEGNKFRVAFRRNKKIINLGLFESEQVANIKALEFVSNESTRN